LDRGKDGAHHRAVHRDLGNLERDGTGMAHDPSTDGSIVDAGAE
jgi:hypothetical protein